MSGQSSAKMSLVSETDSIWQRVRAEADEIRMAEPELAGWINSRILSQPSLETALISRLSETIAVADLSDRALRLTFEKIVASDATIGQNMRADILATFDRDPACHRYVDPVLYFKGYLSLVCHRFAHAMWHGGRREFALLMQSRCSQVLGVDIHPAVQMGQGIMIDHGSGVVIGETAVIGDHVSILQNVTLGGNGKEEGDRHPKIGNHALIGVGANVLGNIKIGSCSRVAASSVVLKDVAPCTTVAGVPAKVVGEAPCPEPASSMNHFFNCPDLTDC